MSDFFSSGWSIFIALTTLVSLLACLVLLVFASRRKPMAGDNSTGHVFDGDLVEMNNPLPLWWVVLFVLTVVFSLGYVYAFPGLGSTPGSLGWTSRGELEADQAKVAAATAKVYGEYAQQPAQVLSHDARAMATGQRLFINNCATCHGSDARGSKGFPNLTDGDWLHGGTPEKIEETITLGRTGVMPPIGRRRPQRERRARRRQLRDEPFGRPARFDRRRPGTDEVRRLRRLPRRRRQGQRGDRRAQPGRQDLAARLGRSGDRRHDRPRQDQRHAGAGRAPHAGADPSSRQLRLEPVAEPAHGVALIDVPTNPPEPAP